MGTLQTSYSLQREKFIALGDEKDRDGSVQTEKARKGKSRRTVKTWAIRRQKETVGERRKEKENYNKKEERKTRENQKNTTVEIGLGNLLQVISFA